MSFEWPEYRNTNSYFLIPSTIFGIERYGERIPGLWSKFSRAEKAIYPILLSHKRYTNTVKIGEERLATLAGLKRRSSACDATNSLENRGLIIVNRESSRRHVKSYTFENIDSPRQIPFYRDDIYSGVWAVMGRRCPTAQALYLAMRYLAKPRPDLDDNYIEYWPKDEDQLREYLMERTEDYCLARQHEILDYAKISRRSFSTAIETLVMLELVCPLDYRDGYSVRLWSERRYEMSVLKSLKVA